MALVVKKLHILGFTFHNCVGFDKQDVSDENLILIYEIYENYDEKEEEDDNKDPEC